MTAEKLAPTHAQTSPPPPPHPPPFPLPPLRAQPKTSFPKEQTDFQRLRPGYTPGDLGFDPLGLKPEDPAELRIMQEKELSHGRLGMIAAAGFMAQEAVSGATWGTYFS